VWVGVIQGIGPLAKRANPIVCVKTRMIGADGLKSLTREAFLRRKEAPRLPDTWQPYHVKASDM